MTVKKSSSENEELVENNDSLYDERDDKLTGYRLYIPAESSKAFCDLIREYVVDSMKYKLSC